jgi:transcriptional regulator with XRE-family HTH domain
MKKYQSPEEIDMSDLLNEVIEQTPPESVRFIKQSLAMADYIERLLIVKGLKQKDLADKMGKSEAEVSKWLSGTHNFTLRSLSKIETVLNETLIEIPKQKSSFGSVRKYHIKRSKKGTQKVTFESKSSNSPLSNGTIFELDESLSRFDGIDLFPKKTARAKEILQKAKIPNRIKSTI